MTNNIELIKELINSGSEERLTKIREGLTKWVPLELIHADDREQCEIIDSYFAAKTQIEQLVEEKCEGLDGMHSINFEYDIYEVEAWVYCNLIVDRGDRLTPDYCHTEIEIINLIITI